eukprot:1822340-Rhodomonas_salina.1
MRRRYVFDFAMSSAPRPSKMPQSTAIKWTSPTPERPPQHESDALQNQVQNDAISGQRVQRLCYFCGRCRGGRRLGYKSRQAVECKTPKEIFMYFVLGLGVFWCSSTNARNHNLHTQAHNAPLNPGVGIGNCCRTSLSIPCDKRPCRFRLLLKGDIVQVVKFDSSRLTKLTLSESCRGGLGNQEGI